MAAVTGNVVHDIDLQRNSPKSHEAAGIRVYDSVFWKNESKGMIALTGNVIRDVGGKGIEIYRTKGKVSQYGNLCHNTDDSKEDKGQE